MLDKLYHNLFFLITPVIYLCLVLYWNPNKVTGDEPHYLIIAKSIANDLDWDLKNNYIQEKYYPEFFGELDWHTTKQENGYFSSHGVGLGLLLAPFINSIGVQGVKIMLAILNGFFLQLLVFRLFQKKLDDRFWSKVYTLAFTLAMPFFVAASTVYNDMLVALIFFYALDVFFRQFDAKRIFYVELTGCLLLVAFSGLMHQRNFLSFLAFASFYLYQIIVFHKDSIKTIALKNIIFKAIPYLVSGIVVIFYLYYNYYSFGGIFKSSFGYVPIQFWPKINILLFLRFHFNSITGLFFLNPLMIIAILGFFPFISNNKKKGLLWLILYLSIVIPASMVVGQNPDGSPFFFFMNDVFDSTRFTWALMVLWVYPLSSALVFFKNKVSKQSIFHSLPFLSLILSFHTLSLGIYRDYIDLMWTADKQYWNFYAYFFNNYLPNIQLGSFFQTILNFHNTFLLIGFLLLFLKSLSIVVPDIFYKKYLVKVSAIWFISLIIYWIYLGNYHNLWLERVFYPNSYFGAVYGGGVKDLSPDKNLGRKVAYNKKEREYFVTGPYLTSYWGSYQATYHLKIPNLDKMTGDLFDIDVSANFGQIILAKKTIKATDLKGKSGYIPIELNFDITYPALAGIEFRVHSHQKIDIYFDRVDLNKISDTLIYPVEKIPFQVGKNISSQNRIIRQSSRQQGFLSFGPYVTLQYGNYQVIFPFKLLQKQSLKENEPICRIEVSIEQGKEVIATKDIFPKDFGKRDEFQPFLLDITVKDNQTLTNVEFRILDYGKADFQLQDIQLVNRTVFK